MKKEIRKESKAKKVIIIRKNESDLFRKALTDKKGIFAVQKTEFDSDFIQKKSENQSQSVTINKFLYNALKANMLSFDDIKKAMSKDIVSMSKIIELAIDNELTIFNAKTNQIMQVNEMSKRVKRHIQTVPFANLQKQLQKMQ